MKILATICAFASLAPATAFAHPGHGHTDPSGWAHYLTEPLHVMPLAVLGSLTMIIGTRLWRAAHSK